MLQFSRLPRPDDVTLGWKIHFVFMASWVTCTRPILSGRRERFPSNFCNNPSKRITRSERGVAEHADEDVDGDPEVEATFPRPTTLGNPDPIYPTRLRHASLVEKYAKYLPCLTLRCCATMLNYQTLP